MTVSTFFPDSGTNSVDGAALRSGVDETLATIRAGAGTSSPTGNATMGADLVAHDTTDPNYQQISRIVVNFHTASLPDDPIIISATLDVVATGKNDDFTDSISLVATTMADPTDIVNADYSQFGSTLFATNLTIAGITADSNTQSQFVLNGNGFAAISLTAVTELGIRITFDITGTPTWAAGEFSRVTIASTETGLGATKRPTLTITHLPASVGALATMNISQPLLISIGMRPY